VLFRKGVEGGQEQAAGAGLDRHQAERRQRQAVVRLEVVQQAALAAVGQDFLVDVGENVRRHTSTGKWSGSDAVGAGERAAVFAAQPVAEQPPASGSSCSAAVATSVSQTSRLCQWMTWPVRVMRTVSAQSSRRTVWLARMSNNSGAAPSV